MKKLIASVAIATMVLTAVPALAMAQGNAGHEGFGAKIAGWFHWPIFGKNSSNFALTGAIVSVSGSSVVVNEDATVHIQNISNGQVTVVTDANTKITGKSNATLTTAQLLAGDRISINGTVSGTTLTATNIRDQGPVPATPAASSGKVTAVSTTSITLVNGLTAASQTFTIDASTKVVIDGTNKTAADIAVGDAGSIKAKANGSVFTATMIDLFR